MRKYIGLFIIIASVSLCACDSFLDSHDPANHTSDAASLTTETYQPANNVTNNTAQTVSSPTVPPVTTPDAYLKAQGKSSQTIKIKNTPRLTGLKAVEAANKKALKQPDSEEYLNSVMTYDYEQGALYKVYCEPLNVTDIEFRPGEHIISVAAGDTLRWQVSKTFSGVGINRVEHLVVKPNETDLQNSVVVTTDQRTYHFMLYSVSDTYMASVQFRYPETDGLVQTFDDNDTDDLSSANVTSGHVNMSHLDFDYSINVTGNSKAEWIPVAVFNDGNKTYIQFPSNMQEAPTLFVGNSDMGDTIVNYRLSGNYYVIDRVVKNMELSLGQAGDTVVQINHGA